VRATQPVLAATTDLGRQVLKPPTTGGGATKPRPSDSHQPDALSCVSRPRVSSHAAGVCVCENWVWCLTRTRTANHRASKISLVLHFFSPRSSPLRSPLSPYLLPCRSSTIFSHLAADAERGIPSNIRPPANGPAAGVDVAWCLASVKPEVPSVPRMAFPPTRTHQMGDVSRLSVCATCGPPCGSAW